MAIREVQKSLGTKRLREIIRTCELQKRFEAAAAFKATLELLESKGQRSISISDLAPEQQEIVEWLTNYGNRQA